ncbi:hypothetical protein E4T56_gene19204 [Termitomyces sp. T112]|nr:hypothetical protein E4T56_gene19204 [Termitomyces sp. T112]
MTAACKECGAHTEWNDDAGSAICTSCGTLADPSQTILTDSSCYNLPSDPWQPVILKSIRTQGHSLSGQSQEARDAKNHYAMSQFISSLATSINASGLSPRATLLFTQAMTAGKFRWGRKAKLVAGASLVLALREYRRPDSLDDIAYLLNVQCPILVRTLASIISLLNLSLIPADPTIHIPHLLAHLTCLLALDPNLTVRLPESLISQLKGVSLRAASNTATSLCSLLARLGPDHLLNSLPSPPTAIAIFLISLEAELRSPLSQLGELVQALGASCHKTSRSVVMARYKLVQDEISTWIEQVPWLGKYKQQLATNGKNRAKSGKRLIVARGVADVIQFQDDIWRGKLRPTVKLDMEDEKDDNDDDSIPKTETSVSKTTSSNQPTLPPPFNASRPTKRQKTSHHPLRDATQFLLNPLVGPLPDCESPPQPLHHPHRIQQFEIPLQDISVSSPPFQNNAHNAHSAPQSLPLPVSCHSAPPPPSMSTSKPSGPSLPSYILTAPSISILHSRVPPTRLQLLIASRGGADAIKDEELFGEGELDGLIRPKEEAEEVWKRLVVLGILGEDDEEDGSDGNGDTKGGRRKKRDAEGKRRGGKEEGQPKKSRVDLDALARLLEDKDEDKDDTGVYDTTLFGLGMFSDKDEDEDGDGGFSDLDPADGELEYWNTKAVAAVMKHGNAPMTPSGAGADEAEVVVDEWRPMSPGAGSGGMYGYEEEYD